LLYLYITGVSFFVFREYHLARQNFDLRRVYFALSFCFELKETNGEIRLD